MILTTPVHYMLLEKRQPIVEMLYSPGVYEKLTHRSAIIMRAALGLRVSVSDISVGRVPMVKFEASLILPHTHVWMDSGLPKRRRYVEYQRSGWCLPCGAGSLA